MLIFVGVVAVIGLALAVARPVIRKSIASRRLQLEESRAEAEARKRERTERAEAFMEERRRYFAQVGIRTVEARSTPRQADMGTLHLEKFSMPDVLWKERCEQGCGQGMVTMHEVAPGREDSSVQGVVWDDIGRYCPACGAWQTNDAYLQHFKPRGPLGRRLRGATNLYDILGDPKREDDEEAWRRLEAETAELEARMGVVRSRRLALAEKLGKQNADGPFRPRLLAGGKES